MMTKQVDENTRKECMARYTAHICFHLLKTYEYRQAAKKQDKEDDISTSRVKPNYMGKSTAREIILASLVDR